MLTYSTIKIGTKEILPHLYNTSQTEKHSSSHLTNEINTTREVYIYKRMLNYGHNAVT